MVVILIILLVIGGICALFGVSFWTAVLILAGIFVLVLALNEKAYKKQEAAKAEKARQYNDPEWRKAHPEEARQYEWAQQAKAQEEHARNYGAAVCIDQIQGGHWDGVGYAGWSPWADSAGGWDVKCRITNVGARTISSATIIFAALDASGKKCYCSTHSYYDARCNYNGPLPPNKTDKDVIFRHLWYNVPIASISVESIHINFADGKSQDISKNGIVTNHGF